MFYPAHAHAASLSASSIARLNTLDWGLLLLVGTSTVMAFLRGLIRSLISAFGVLLGIVLAAWYAPALAPVLYRWIPQAVVAEILAYLLIISGAYVVATLLGRVLRGAAKAIGLGFFDRLGGAAFGFGRAVLVLAVVLLPATPFLPLLPLTRDSVLLPYLQTAAHGVSFVMPQDFGSRLLAGANRRVNAAARRPHPGSTQTTLEGETQ